ncbi:sensor histidine kinase [Lewinella cohaerens]|uniref:sensor histidine kinase n=1 Tax=Lewinella cohaerens TaxID=70995 RepID=UPI000366960F|nr:histidine kinase [Lewinella cohaerens]
MHSSLPIPGLKRLLWFTNLVLYSGLITAQSVQPFSFNYTTEDGLPSAECYEVLQDSKGYIWVSTDNGVSRFNGDEFKNYGTEEGLLDKTVLFMHEDHRGWIWMSTLSGNFYIHRGDTIAAYEYNYLFQESRTDYNLVHDFIVDKEGNLHASLMYKSVIKITPQGVVSEWTLSMKSTLQFGLYEIEDGFLQNTTRNDQLSFTKFHVLSFKSTISKNYQEETTLDRDSLTGSGGKTSYFLKLGDQYFFNHRTNNIFLDQHFNPQRIQPFHHGTINCALETKTGMVFIGFFEGKGIRVYENRKDFQYDSLSFTLLDNYTVSHLFEDKKGGIWIATTEKGIFYIPSMDHRIFDLNIAPDQYRGITAISPHKEGLYIGTKEGRWFNIHQEKLKYELPLSENAFDLLMVKYHQHSKTLITSAPVKIFRNDAWHSVYHHINDTVTSSSVALHGLIDDLPETNITGYSHAYIYHITLGENNSENTLQQLLFPFDLKNINCAAGRDLDHLWVGSRAGLYQYSQTANTLLLLEDPLLHNEQINALQLLPDESLLIGTKRKGLLHYKDGMVQRPSFNDQLATHPVNKICTDYQGHIWVVTKQGIYKISYQDSLRQEYLLSTQNGLSSPDVIDIAIQKDKLWTLGPQEINIFPLSLESQNHSLQVIVEDIFVNEAKVPVASLKRVPYDSNISIRFSSLNFSAYKPNRYRYRLFTNDQWVEITQPRIDLLDLAPNDYSLEIQVFQSDQQWSTSASLSIAVIPPFWQRSWFIVLGLALGLVLIYWLFKRRLNLLAREQERLKLKEQVTELKQRAYRAQMNPHFIFNCMSTIQGMIIGDNHDQDQAVKMLANFSRLIRMSLEFSEAETLSLEEETTLLENYLSLEQIRFNHNFSYAIEIDPDLDPDWIRLPPMLVQPFVENAVLHGMEKKTGDGKIVIQYKLAGEGLLVKIIDNGPGISVTKAQKHKNKSKYQHKSLGMTITQRRLEILNHEDYNFLVEEPRDDHGNIVGTTVTINIPVFS